MVQLLMLETPRMAAGGLKKPESDPTHSTSRTTLWARVKDLPML